ncbi:2,5-diamino-6-(ribosylamino)-4(3H)-pyrimidinone 5'-phosphate reductase [Neocucurbitaria cava]|uniref:2,5-diamino-6-ribosylamino-4(3H)-pyrimidinone 5'-phosphate reductase n=1 Tax=Neocucurbitaria cava TaxID=798079 RepID=A0A9W8YBY9_9PLEO|nr:2,5-diamino-6-(ribosylamino)-4(3H)-pyrimidinone 5'-phosphate reductase [Neocucurbitaria cava]
MMTTRDALRFPTSQSDQIDPYLPPSTSNPSKPFVTLTFATSLDSQLSLAPGVQTALSGPESKAMTHYLRSKHDTILIGVGTAVADDPSLNCRIEGVGGYGGQGLAGQPRPVVVDPKGRWDFHAESKVMRLAREGKGKAPWLITGSSIKEEEQKLLESVGGKVLELPCSSTSSIPWSAILDALTKEGASSVMIEGGGVVINDLLSSENFRLIDSVIVTIAPTWLGKGGVQVCPKERIEDGRRIPVGRLKGVKWVPLGEDVVLCGHPKLEQ